MKRRKLFILFPLLFLALLPFVVMQLWNHIVVAVFHAQQINYVQALGIFILSRILFGGFHFGNRPYRNHRQFKAKWFNMSPEEREQFKHEWRSRKNSC